LPQPTTPSFKTHFFSINPFENIVRATWQHSQDTSRDRTEQQCSRYDQRRALSPSA
jgi:hypothetical protein